MADGDFKVEGAQLVAIRGIILKDASALTNWAIIKDKFIPRVEDQIRVNGMLRVEVAKYGRAILTTLQCWASGHASQATFNNLIKVLETLKSEGYPMGALIAKLTDPDMRKQIREAEQKNGITDHEQDKRFPVSNFQIFTSATEVARIIHGDNDAVKEWSTVKDVMVTTVSDNLNVDNHLNEKEQYAAIVLTVQNWCSTYSDKANLHSLLDILLNHGLRALTEKLLSKEVVNTLRGLEGKGPDPGYAPPPKVEKMDCNDD